MKRYNPTKYLKMQEKSLGDIDNFLLSKILTIDQGALIDKIKTVWKNLNINPNAPFGKCEDATVALWLLLGKPKDLSPYFCQVGEDYHAVLYNKKERIVLDITYGQYSDEQLFLGWAEKGPYKRLTKATNTEIADLLDELP